LGWDFFRLQVIENTIDAELEWWAILQARNNKDEMNALAEMGRPTFYVWFLKREWAMHVGVGNGSSGLEGASETTEDITR